MKKKVLSLAIAAVMLALILAGCGASNSKYADTNVREEAMSAPAAGEMLNSASVSTAPPQSQPDQKLIRRVEMNVETEDLEALLPHVNEKIAQLGGYIENQELYNGSAYSAYRSRSANLTIRIPAENLDQFVENVRDQSNVVNYNESTENVTLVYVSTESRLKALEVEQERLLELLSKAENMSDLLEIEARLTDVRYELENVASQLRVLSNQVDYATVRLYIDQVRVYTEVEPQTVWQRIGTGFRENLRNIGDSLKNFFVWAVTYSPQLIFLAILGAVVIVLVMRRRNRRPVKKAPFPKQETDET